MAAIENTAGSQAPRVVGSVPTTMFATGIRWLPVALVIAVTMLLAVLVVALLSGEARRVPASGPPFVVGNIYDAARTLGENLLVLLLYAMGSLGASGVHRWRWGNAQHRAASRGLASRLAVATLVGLLVFVACRQGFVLAHGLAGYANFFYVPRWRLWLAVLPHALPELTGIFLPVAAWRCACREEMQQTLPALTAAAVLAALPLVASAALIETYVSPEVFRAVTCIGEREGFRGGGDCGAQTQECPKLGPVAFERRFHLRLSQAQILAARRGCSAPTKRH